MAHRGRRGRHRKLNLRLLGESQNDAANGAESRAATCTTSRVAATCSGAAAVSSSAGWVAGGTEGCSTIAAGEAHGTASGATLASSSTGGAATGAGGAAFLTSLSQRMARASSNDTSPLVCAACSDAHRLCGASVSACTCRAQEGSAPAQLVSLQRRRRSSIQRRRGSDDRKVQDRVQQQVALLCGKGETCWRRHALQRSHTSRSGILRKASSDAAAGRAGGGLMPSSS